MTVVRSIGAGRNLLSILLIYMLFVTVIVLPAPARATTFTMDVPGTSLRLPTGYPEAGGVAIVMVGANGNAYYQFSNPTGAFVGYQNTGSPTAFRGNPFTINSPISLNCGYSQCSTYFGGSIAKIYIRFSALDGDTQVGGFDYNDITLRLNGYTVDNWSNITTQSTNNLGTVAYSTQQGFGNNTFDTGWFTSTNSALLANILSTGKTSTQVYDQDPNDNYWDFTGGGTLTNNNIITVAPGYSLTKDSNRNTFTAVGDTIVYTYVITNIGSVPIRQMLLVDDKISNINCNNQTVILSVQPGQTPNSITCTASYRVTQADFDAEKVTNIAKATGVPDYGNLGELTATKTVTGQVINPSISLQKTTTAAAFGAVGTSVPYSLRVQNTGDATLNNVVVSDPKLPALSCSFATMAPGAIQICTGSYVVKQSDLDAFATSGTRLSNTASVTSRDPKNVARTATSTVTLPGPTPVVTMTVKKTTTATNFSTVGTSLPYQILITNTGTVTWPAAPTVTDTLTSVTCPAGAVAPNAAITCSANYAVLQGDIDAGKVDNTASATITIGTLTAAASSSVSVPAVRTTGLSLSKRLALTSPTSFDNNGTILTYVYELRNTGNVTLNTVAVTDNRVAVTCPGATLLPNATMLCTSANYATTQTNLNSGGVTNTATATATAAISGGVVTSNTAVVTVPAVQLPAITLVKTAPVLITSQYTAGAVVTYSYRVTNSGNVRIYAADQITITDDKIGTFNCGSGDLTRGSNRDCTAQYILKPADILAGLVVNTAVAKAGTIAQSNVDTATISPTFAPALSVVKTANVATVALPSDVITYSFLVKNEGNNQIVKSGNPITVDDPMVGAVDCSAQPALLNPTESFSCTATYNPTQVQLDAGRIRNTATASYPFTGGGAATTVTSASSTVEVGVVETVALTLDKTGPADFTAVGQDLTYGFAVKNDGNTTLTSTTVRDPLIPALVCTLTNIAPGLTKSCTGTYRVTQADMDAGVINNIAVAQGRTAQGGTANSTDAVTVPVAPSVVLKAATFTKTANKTSFAAVGEQIVYTLAVANTGAQTLRNITVTDTLNPGYSCAIPVLLPTITNNTCTYTHLVTQADIDRGTVVNAASAASADFPTTLTSSVTVTGPVRNASYTFAKTASGPFVAKDDVVNFTMAVTNTGTVTLTNVQITDTFFTPPKSCTIPSLLPGVTNSTCQASYTILQSDVNNGQITNTANLSASAPAGVTAPLPTTATAIVQGPISRPAVSITKTPSANTYGLVGDAITYNFAVTNSGNVTLTNLTVTDAALSFTCALDNLAPQESTSTCAGGAPALSKAKSITQAEIDQGAYTNTVTVAGQSLVGGTAVSGSAISTVTGPVQNPTLSMTKTSALGGPFNTLNQQIPYNYAVTNTGNITMTGVFSVVDNKIANVTCPALPAAGLAPTLSVVCTGTYRVTQLDLDTGSVTNLATASTVQPVIPQALNEPAFKSVSTGQVPATVLAQQLPKLTLDKRVKASSPSSYGALNDEVVFEYVVTNRGNVTTTAPITIVDDKIAGTLTCGAAGLAPGGVVTCEQIWKADQPALNDGEVTNTATASTVFNSATVDSISDSATITAVQKPALSMVKTLVAPIPVNFGSGEILNYQYVVTNSGNVSINGISATNLITVSDNLTPVSCPVTPVLNPQASITCAASYTLGLSDLQLGSTTNVAVASGTFNGVAVKSPQASVLFPVAATPAITLAKSTTATGFSALGEVISYSYVVTNPVRQPGQSGVDLIEDVYVDDDKIGRFLCRAATEGIFAIGDSYTCTRPYTVTQADLDANTLSNNAIAETVFAKNTVNEVSVASASQSVVLPGAKDPKMVVEKLVNPGTPAGAVGDTIGYTITTTNTGNQTLRGVVVTDPLIGALACTVDGVAAAANVVLAPTKALVCTGSYVVKQTNVDTQVLLNTASARGADPQGVTRTATDDVTHPLVAPVPGIEVTKEITPAPGPDDAFAALNQKVTFVVTVRNTGNVTLNSTTVTDDLVDGTCSVGPLAPMETDSSCEFVYVVKQSDLDALNGPAGGLYGGFLNTAKGVAQPANPGAVAIEDEGEVFAKGPAREPALALVKEALTSDFDEFGDVITYQFTVANIGNVSLTQPISVTDALLGAPFVCGTLPVGGLPPGEFMTCTRDYPVTQADVDAGVVTNVATVASDEVPLPTDPALQGPMRATATVNGVRTPAMVVDKVASITTGAKVGDVIAYTYTVRNSGKVTLTNIRPTDQHTSAAGSVALVIADDALGNDLGELGNSTDGVGAGVWGSLGPGDDVTFGASYTVTQADVDQGITISNTVTVTADSPAGTTVPDATDTATVAVEVPDGEMTAIKSVTESLSSPPKLGDTLTYAITLTNTGNVTLSDVMPTETFLDAKGAALTLTVGLTGPAGDDGDGLLQVDEEWTYSASFTLNQQAIDAGGVSNSVGFEANDPFDTPITETSDDDGTNGEDPTVTPLTRTRILTVVKTAMLDDGGDGRVDEDDTITYSYIVKNSGNTTMFDIGLAETGFTGTGTAPVPVLQSGGADLDEEADATDLAAGTESTYSVVYSLTQADIDAGGVDNQATVTGTDPDGAEVTDLSGLTAGDDDVTSTTITPTAVLDVQKRADVSALTAPIKADQVITYSVTVENTGNVTMKSVTPVDTLTDAKGGDLELTSPLSLVSGDDGDGLLQVGEKWVYAGSYKLGQAAIDAGGVSNTVEVTATTPKDAEISDISDDDGTNASDPTVTSFAPAPEMLAIKSVTAALSNPPKVGDVLTYAITVENTGNVSLRSVVLTDALTNDAGAELDLFTGPDYVSGDLANPAVLDVGEVWVYAATYKLSQADIDAGGVSNVLTVDAKTPELAPVTETADDDGTNPDDPTATSIQRTAGIGAVKSASFDAGADGVATVGDLIAYTYTVENTGNVTILDIGVTETNFTGTGILPVPAYVSGGSDQGGDAGIIDLAVGQTALWQVSYALTQADIDAGFVNNQATAKGTGPSGAIEDVTGATTDDNAITATNLPQVSRMTVEKIADVSALASPVVEGNVVGFTVRVANTGNVTLTDVALTEDFARRDGTELAIALSKVSGDAGVSDVLEVGETWVYTGSYALTQDDINAGGVRNAVSADAVAPGAVPVNDLSDDGDDTDGNTTNDPTVVAVEGKPALSVVKVLAPGSTAAFDRLGQILSYDFTVTNTGNITITAPVVVSDALITDAGGSVVCDAPPILPTETVDCTGSYAITQGDLDRGSVLNAATVSVTQPVVPVVTGGPATAVATSELSDVTAFADPKPAVALTKRIKAGSAASFAAVGDRVTFEYVVKNTGNVTLLNPITVTDDKIAGILACAPGPLAPLAEVVCEQDWIATQADLDLAVGQVTNSAVANTSFAEAPVASPAKTVTITAVQNPELSFEKTLKSAVPDVFDVDTVLSYDFVVTNSGNVTIAGPITVVDSITTATCDAVPTAGLEPTGTVACRATYSLRAGDIALGSAVNVAKARGSFAGEVVTSASDSAIYPVDAVPAISVVKASVPANVTFDRLNQVVQYSYTITNTGKAAFSEAIEIDDNRMGDSFVCWPDGTAVFGVGDVHSCTHDYVVTQADLDRGFVTNEASAKTVFAPGTPNEIAVTTPVAKKTVTSVKNARLGVVKTVVAGPATVALGDVLTYKIVVRNDGNQTLNAVSIADPRIADLACTKDGAALPSNVVLLPGETVECLGDYTVTQTDVDTQSLTNTAVATGNDPQGATVNASDVHSQSVVAADPKFEVVKTLLPDVGAAAAFTAKDKALTFVVTLRNTGNVTLNNLSVTDDLVDGQCTLATLAPGASNAACRFVYPTTQADVNALNGTAPVYGGFTNIATGRALPANPGATELQNFGAVFVRGPDHAPAFTLAKSASVSVAQGFGDPITYSYVVTNAGNITLTQAPVVTDDKIDNINCAPMPFGGLIPGGQLLCTADYVVTQGDADAGFVTNKASVSSAEVLVPATAEVTVPIARGPGLSVDKQASITAGAKLGDVIGYTYTVTNTGNVVLSNIGLTDQHTSAVGTAPLAIAGDVLVTDAGEQGNATDAAINGAWDQLGPGDSVLFTASYTVTQADIDAGAAISNVVEVTGQGPSGTVPPVTTDRVSVSVEKAVPSITAIKTLATAGLSTPPVAGEALTYTIRIQNTGTATLRTVAVQDVLRRADGVALSLTSGPTYVSGNAETANMELGEEWVYTATYKLTQADIDAGGVTNQVTVTAIGPKGAEARDLSDDGIAGGVNDPTRLLIPANPSISAIKTIVASATEVGGVVEFEIAVTNTGNVTLTQVGISDERLTRADGTALTLTSAPGFTGSSMGSGLGTLLPGEVAIYRATYRLVQADLDAGGVANLATVSGKPPLGAPVTDISDDGNTGPGDTGRNPTVQSIDAAPAMVLVKALADGSGPVYSAAGQVLTYDFRVTNTGNVTLTDPIRINDPLLGAAFDCGALPLGGLLPQAVQVCSANYVVIQADVDAGSVSNTATASDGTTNSPPSTVVTQALQAPVLTVVKAASALTAAEFVTGKIVDYTYTVTNAGNVTVTDPIAISDNRIEAAAITCPVLPVGGLLPGGVLICSAQYTVTSDDVDLGTVTNLATATDGVTVSPIVTVTIPNEGKPALSITKTADVGSFTAVGDTIGYTYVVTNAGTRAFAAPVVVIDDKLGEIACFAPSVDDPDLTAGETVTCSALHTVTQADLDRGTVTNQAYGRTTYGGGDVEVVSDAGKVTVSAALTPALSLSKTSAPDPVSGVGEVVTYSIVAKNTGNQTLRTVVVSDPMLPALSCSVGVLAPGQSLPCSGTYIVRQSDIDRGDLINTAFARAVTPQGDLLRQDVTHPAQLPTIAPSVSLVKTATPSPFGRVGSNLTYLFAATNTGNVTLTNLIVTDPMDAGFSCTIAVLAPSAVDRTCRMTVAVTQAQVDAGGVSNVASISGTDPAGTTVSGQAAVTTAGPQRVPAIEVTKIVLPSASTLGSEVRFQVLVRNAGNVTLDPQAPVDTMVRLTGAAAPLDAPLALVSGDAGIIGRLDVGETWVYAAKRTLTQDDLNAGGLRNTVKVTATAPGVGGVTDVSDNGNDSDGNSVDDPTVFVVARAPALELTKVISGSEGSDVGDAVTFTLTAVNTGNVTLNSIAVVDTMTRGDGTVVQGVTLTGGASSLLPGETADWTLVHILTRDDIDAGGLENTAVISGMALNGTVVTDRSSNGNNADGNISDDPTLFVVAPQPDLVVRKTLDSIGTLAGEDAVFTITATNSGTVTLRNVAVVDQLTQLGTDADLGALPVVFVGNSLGSAAGQLLPGEVATWTVRYVLTQADVDAGGVSNSARVTSTAPTGTVITDISDDDGVGDSDSTIGAILGAPTLEVVKSASIPEFLFPTVGRIAFTLSVTNTGNVTQNAVRLADDLAPFLGSASLAEGYPVLVTATGFGPGTANPAYNGLSVTETLAGDATLVPGATGVVVITIVTSSFNGTPSGENIGGASSAQLNGPILSNPVTVNTNDSDGDGIPDLIEGTGDRDNDGVSDSEDYDPTGTFYCQEDGRILSGGRISVTGPLGTQSGVGTSNGIIIVKDGSDGRFQFFMTQAGSYRLTLTYPPGGVPSTTRTSAGVLDATSLLPANPGSLGSGENVNTARLVDFSAGSNVFYSTFDVAAGDPYLINNNIPLEGCVNTPDVSVTKTADRTSAVFGETVNFTLVYENNTAQTFVGANLVDMLPDGMVYTPGSGQLDGVAFDPVVTGRRIGFGPIVVAPAQRLVVRLGARVSASGSYGTLTNKGWMEDSSGAVVSNVATASVKVTPEAVFDCTDIIGKVFDDKNRNGYQDAIGGGEVTNQDIFVDKLDKLAAPIKPVETTEPGLPGVRLATVNGLLITTDEYGRFHVPCAALPKKIGSNFALKVDTRTLPQSYKMTTENPRVIRVTPGKVAKMNFGAALSNVIDIDLTSAAFAKGTATPNAAFVTAVKGLVQRIKAKPTSLQLSYLLRAGEDRSLAATRLKAAESVIRKAWRGVGRYELEIDRSVKRVQ